MIPNLQSCVLMLTSALGSEIQPRKNNQLCSRKVLKTLCLPPTVVAVPSQNTVFHSYLGGHCSLSLLQEFTCHHLQKACYDITKEVFSVSLGTLVCLSQDDLMCHWISRT